MRTITREELDEILINHQHWLAEDCDNWENMRADLSNADLSNANLSNANLWNAVNISYIPLACPDTGGFIAWKKAHHHIVKLFVSPCAKRVSATTRKCRCNRAYVIAIENMDGTISDIVRIESDYNYNFVYEVGKIVEEKEFDENRWNECSKGIHFFINRQEAVDY